MTVTTNSACTKLLFDEKKRVRGVRVVERGDGGKLSDKWEDIEIGDGGEVVVSLGALQTPQLLNLSGIGDEEELKKAGVTERVVHNPAVGKNLQDHYDILLNGVIRDYSQSKSSSFRNMKFLYDQYKQYRYGDGGGIFRTIIEYGGFVKSDPSLPRPDLQLHYQTAILLNHAKTKNFDDGFSLHLCHLYPSSRGTIGIRSNNPQDHPVINPNMVSTEEDEEVQVRAFDIGRRIIDGEAFQKFNPRYDAKFSPPALSASREEKLKYIRQTGDSIYHPVGTCSMGKETDPGSVVDSKLRLLGVNGVRIADASIMPFLLGGNTNAPSMMIGMKAAKFISGV